MKISNVTARTILDDGRILECKPKDERVAMRFVVEAGSSAEMPLLFWNGAVYHILDHEKSERLGSQVSGLGGLVNLTALKIELFKTLRDE